MNIAVLAGHVKGWIEYADPAAVCEGEEVSYDVLIRKNETGEVRRYCMDGCEWHDEIDEASNRQRNVWVWTEGNFGCDCNRGDFFAQAGGEDDPDEPCGHTKYTVLRAVLPDGRRILIDDDPDPTAV